MQAKQVSYGLFVCGATAALWCFSIIAVKFGLGRAIVPANAYYLLAIPAAWFYGRSEYNRLTGRAYGHSRGAAAALLTFFLGCYLIPPLFQWLALTDYPAGFAHYHHYALLALAAAILLIRLHAYGGSVFSLCWGALAGLSAFFFILTAIPVLSPLYYPLNTALAAFFLSCFLFVMAQDHGLLKDALVKFAAVTDARWATLKRCGLTFLLFACILLLFLSFIQPVKQPLTGAQLAALLAQKEIAGTDAMLPQAGYFISLAVIVLAGVSAFFYFERALTPAQYQRLAPLLWLALALLLVYSACFGYVLYSDLEQFAKLKFGAPVFRLQLQIIVWALVSFIVGRFSNLSPLWLWGLCLLYPLLLPAITGYSQAFVAYHPFTLACAAIGLALGSVITARVKVLFESAHPWPWAQQRFLRPAFLFSAASQALVYLVFLQAATNNAYRHAWFSVAGLFLTIIPALLVAHSLGVSRHFLFFLPYAGAWGGLMFALQAHFPQHTWLATLKAPHLAGCGLFMSLVTAVGSDYVVKTRQRAELKVSALTDPAYRALKYLAAAGIILLIGYAYALTRNIETIPWPRFVTSGILTLGAGLYFRYLIRDKHKRTCYAFFMYGVTLSILCFSLVLVKFVFQIALTPTVLFWLLLLPPLWFYQRSEFNRAAGRIYESSRDAATELLFYLLLFYLFPALAQWLLLPNYTGDFWHYVRHAPLALVLGLLLIRLHALDGRAWLIFAGITTEITAAFFLATRLPELFGPIPPQPPGKTLEFFTQIMVGLSYVVLISTRANGWLRQALTRFGGIQEALWRPLRVFLGAGLLGVSHLFFFSSLAQPANQQTIGLLCLLLAGLWVYTGYASRKVVLYSLAYVEIVAAFFACRFYPSLWPETWIIWLLVALFGLLIPIYSLFLQGHASAAQSFYAWLIVTAACVLYEQVTFYGVQSKLGLLALCLLWLATFCVPVSQTARTQPLFRTFLGALLYCPALFFFLLQGNPSLAQLPQVALAAVLTSCLLLAYRLYDWQWLADDPATAFSPSTPGMVSGVEGRTIRIAQQLHWYLTQPHSFLPVFCISTLAVAYIQLANYAVKPAPFMNQFFVMVSVQGILAVYWFRQARNAKSSWWTLTAEAMLAGIILTLRQGLPRLLDVPWTVNWDLAVGVFAAFAITAARPLLSSQDRAIRMPIRFTLIGLPLVTVTYALNYAVGMETLARVILLYSVLFLWQAYSEKDRFVLAYAFFGLNAYLLLLFAEHQIQSVQAYLTPVCISVLILVQVFRDITSSATANFVRGTALIILFGVAMFQALADNYLSPRAHLIVLGLSSLAIIGAGLLRIRIFAATGLFCFGVDLLAIMYIVLSRQETESLKVMLGVGLTVSGGIVLAGYILYRKNKARVEAAVSRLKATFDSWE